MISDLGVLNTKLSGTNHDLIHYLKDGLIEVSSFADGAPTVNIAIDGHRVKVTNGQKRMGSYEWPISRSDVILMADMIREEFSDET